MTGWNDFLAGAEREQKKSAPAPVASTEPTTDAERRAIPYIAKMPEAIEGQNGSGAAFNVARVLTQDFGLDIETAKSIFRAHYNPRCQPPWSDEEIDHKFDDAKNKARVSKPIPDRPKTKSNGSSKKSERVTHGLPSEPPPSDAPDAAPQSESAEQAPAFELVTLGSLLVPALDRAERRRMGKDTPVPLPFRELAENLGGGLWSGAHSLVSGTGVGKSQIAIAIGLHAALHGASVCYVGLELDDMQLALRVIGADVGLRWSSLYLGRCNAEDIERGRTRAAQLEGLPFYVDFGEARSWPASRLFDLAEAMRKKQPSGPILIVLDYLQLVGDEPSEYQRRPDLRERIGGAAYAARDVARRFGVSVLLISSAARNHYGLLAGDFASAGLTVRPDAGKIIAHPYVLQGLGKESGELEFSLDTNTVMLRWPARLDNGESIILAASPKVRAGRERWCAFAFDGGRFAPLDVQSLDDLPEPPKRSRSGGRERVSETEIEKRVVEQARRNPSLGSRNKLALATKGTRTEILAAIDRLTGDGRLEFSKDRVVVRNERGEANE